MNKKIIVRTKVIEHFDDYYQVEFTIGNQTFGLEPVKSTNKGMTSKEYAEWYEKNLRIALSKLSDLTEVVDIDQWQEITNDKEEDEFISLMEDNCVLLRGLPLKDALSYGKPSGIGIKFPYWVRENSNGTWEFHQKKPSDD